MEGKSCPGNGNSQSWVWLYQGLVSFTMSQGMSCHTITFLTLVASWHALESSKKRRDILWFCVCFTKKSIQVTEQITQPVSKCQSTRRGKALFLGAFPAEQVQLLGRGSSHQNRNALDGFQDLSKPRHSKTLEEASN